LQVGLAIVNKGLSHLRIQDKCNTRKYIKRLPEEYEKCLVGLDKHKRSFEIQLIILRIKEKEYRHYHWLMCKKKISKNGLEILLYSDFMFF